MDIGTKYKNKNGGGEYMNRNFIYTQKKSVEMILKWKKSQTLSPVILIKIKKYVKYEVVGSKNENKYKLRNIILEDKTKLKWQWIK